MTLRLGIVGAGAMGAKVAAAAAQLDDVVLTAVADRDVARAQALAAPQDAAAVATLDELAALGTVDGVYIALPHDQHRDACVAAARAGLHILIDKPLCNTDAEAAAIIAARDDAGIRVMVGFSYRFRAEWMQARDLISAGVIGDVEFISDTIIEAQESMPAWYWDPAAGGGALQIQSHHSFDRLMWLTGSPFATIGCQTVAVSGEAVNSAAITATQDSGALAAIAIGFGRAYRSVPSFVTVIQGTRGQISLDFDRSLQLDTAQRHERFEYPDDDWMRTEVQAFAELCAGTAGAPTAEDGRAALACALAAVESAANGGVPVELR